MDAHRTVVSTSNRSFIANVVAVVAVLLLFWTWTRPSHDSPTLHKALAVISGDSSVSGTVIFEQSSKSGPVTIRGELTGLDPSAKRGFHIHALGDMSNGCTSAGAHFNPFHKTHGAPTDKVRHVGDLGNIISDANGVVKLHIEDHQLTLNGPLSIVGRAVVLHSGTDDLGRGNDDESQKTGNAGARAACGVIGIAEIV
ncbi:superoxide dismutase [Amylostereum chailletii]|nr:superoxide dismutase [Amylostereum chailletii]